MQSITSHDEEPPLYVLTLLFSSPSVRARFPLFQLNSYSVIASLFKVMQRYSSLRLFLRIFHILERKAPRLPLLQSAW